MPKPKLEKSPKSPIYASKPPSPVAVRNVDRQRMSDEKAASLLGVERIIVDYTKTPVVHRLQQGPEEALLEKKSLSLELPRKDVRHLLYDISERPSEEYAALREEMILNDVRLGGALETDPQQRPTLDLSKLFDLTSMQIKSDNKEKHYSSPRPDSQVSDPFDLSIGSLSPRDSLRSSLTTGEDDSIKSRRSLEGAQPSSSSHSKTAKSTNRTSSTNLSIEIKRDSQEVDEIFAEFVDIDALRQVQWKKERNIFTPSPQERDILIVIRKTMARLLALNMLTRDLQDARGLPLNNFEIPDHFYRMSDPSILQSVRDAASSFASGYRVKQLCSEYDQWAYENGTENLATLAANDCFRQYTEGWQKVFHEYGPWAWNLPDGGQLGALKSA